MKHDTFDYARDKRSPQKLKYDYFVGKAHEREIIKRLSNYFPIRNVTQDKFQPHDIPKYSPDCCIFLKGAWVPLEIKWSSKDMPFFDWKLNQWEVAKQLNIKALFVMPSRFALISPFEPCQKRKTGYCDKEVMRFHDLKWMYSIEMLNV